MRRQVVKLPDGSISYLEAGEGPDLILLHGGGLDNAELSWGHVLPNLARDFHVIAPDWPGYGKSSQLQHFQTTNGLIECLRQMFGQLGITSAHIAGISMGGGAALGFSLSHPNKVKSLILLGSYGFQSHAPLHKLSYLTVHTPCVISFSWRLLRWSRTLTRLTLKRIMRQRNAITESLISQCHEALQSPTAGKAFLSWQKSEVRWNRLNTCYLDRVSEIQKPVLVIHGANDPLVPLKTVKQAVKGLPKGSLCIFQNTGHWPQREAPAQFIRETTRFLRSQ